MTAPDLDAIRKRLAAAEQEVSRLCDGGRWTMSVPVREDTDSDTALMAAVEDAEALLAEVERLKAEHDRALWAVHPENLSPHRPADTYDIVLAEERSEVVVDNLSHRDAVRVATAHNGALG